MRSDEPPGVPRRRSRSVSVSRRALLTGAVVGAATAAGGAAVARPDPAVDLPTTGLPTTGLPTTGLPTTGLPTTGLPTTGLYGDHQPGIATVPLPFLSLAGFDVVGRGPRVLETVLRTWTRVAEELTDGRSAPAPTLTFGFGPSLFSGDRFGIAARRPAALLPLPAFPGDAIDPAASHGDLCVQACAADPTAAHQAVRDLLNAVRPQVALRWRQTGFRADDGTADPRGLFGFRDGTVNLDLRDEGQVADQLWVSDGPAWLHGGSYLVVRRIRLLLDTWDRTSKEQQEMLIGRERDSNRRLVRHPGSHAALAAPRRNGGVRMLRRSYSYDAGVDPNGLLDSGLIFLSFQQHPEHFVRVQRRLAAADPLNGFSQHLSSAVFACPPGIRPGSHLGAELLS